MKRSSLESEFPQAVGSLLRQAGKLLLLTLGLTAAWLLYSERVIWRLWFGSKDLSAESCNRLLVGGPFQVACSEGGGGNKTYASWEIRQRKRVCFSFWGANSLFRSPRVLVGPGYLLTYQPELDPSDTPLGEVIAGWVHWRWDGSVFHPRPLAQPEFNRRIWNPIRFPD